MRVMVILNPFADLGHGLRKKEQIEQEGQRWGGLDLVVTENRGHARDLACSAAEDGYDVVVAAGGDGTVHEVVNGLILDGMNNAKLGVIPIGSGNDFAFGLNIPTDVPSAIDMIFEGNSRAVDLGEVEDDRGNRVLFDNNLGIGFDANVVIRVEAVTKLHGFAKYFWGVLKTLILDFQPLHFNMRFDEEKLAEDVLFITFGIGTRHGGGFMLTPDAQFDDKLIDTCTVKPLGRLRALALLNSAVKGTHTGLPIVSMRQNQQIEITCNDPLPIHIDGEVFAHPSDGVHHLVVNCLPAAIEVIVKRDAVDYHT